MEVSVIGFGSRGTLYSEIFSTHSGIKIKAVCDKREERLNIAKDKHDLGQDMLFNDEDDFFDKGKLSDLLIVSTPDALHTRHAIKALELGYDLLLEKPIATSLEDCNLIYQTAVTLNRKVFVCHVLRYAKFFSVIQDELEKGTYGKISTINLTENVAFWHYAHSYVRGNWRRKDISSPMIIAKCCHDLDLISWMIGKKCLSVSSMGSLNFYNTKNAPVNSAERCFDCPQKKTCAYDAESFYITERFEKDLTDWPVNVLVAQPTKDGILKALKEGPYGKCVFKCDNDVVDHQIVNMLFEDGITAHLTMTAFSKDSYRDIHIHCEQGEIFGNMKDNILTCNIFGGESKKIDISKILDNAFGHGGGDYNMIKDIVAYFNGKPTTALTEIKHSMQSHFIGYAAENSRMQNGALIKLI